MSPFGRSDPPGPVGPVLGTDFVPFLKGSEERSLEYFCIETGTSPCCFDFEGMYTNVFVYSYSRWSHNIPVSGARKPTNVSAQRAFLTMQVVVIVMPRLCIHMNSSVKAWRFNELHMLRPNPCPSLPVFGCLSCGEQHRHRRREQ